MSANRKRAMRGSGMWVSRSLVAMLISLQALEERIPLDPPQVLRREGVHMFHQLRRRIAVHLHPVIVGKFSEEHVPSFPNVHRMLDETLRVHISFENLKLTPISAYKPVIA